MIPEESIYSTTMYSSAVIDKNDSIKPSDLNKNDEYYYLYSDFKGIRNPEKETKLNEPVKEYTMLDIVNEINEQAPVLNSLILNDNEKVDVNKDNDKDNDSKLETNKIKKMNHLTFPISYNNHL